MSDTFRFGGFENLDWRGEQPLPPEAIAPATVLKYTDFSKGYNSANAPENTPDGASPYMLDMELSRQDRLIRAPGTTAIETLTRTPSMAVLHPGFTFASELVLLDAPYVGVKYTGATTWTDEGIAAGDAVFANYAGVLLFSTGTNALYSRQPLGAVATVVSAPGARTIAVFAGRVIVGGTYGIGGGPFDPLLLRWSDKIGDYSGWDITQGAGEEALIVDVQYADRIVALRPMGFDYLAILNRRSVWIATRTGDENRPIDPQPRIPEIGCIAERTAFTTKNGVLFLSDDGVYLFTGNDVQQVSEAINSELLPIDETQLEKYRAAYNPGTHRYYLFTPTATWVLDMFRMRWFRWSTVLDMGVVFPVQVANPTWDESTGAWDAEIGTWDNDLGTESGSPTYFVRGTSLVREDYTQAAALGVTLQPRWDGRPDVGDETDQHLRVDRITLIHEGSGLVTVALPSFDGTYEDVRTVNITAPGPSVIHVNHTGRGAGLGLRYEAGANLKVRRASLRARPAGAPR